MTRVRKPRTPAGKRTKRLQVLVTDGDELVFKTAAREAGLSLSGWAYEQLLTAVDSPE